MNKHVFGRKLSRSRPAREALFASLARSLILNGKIETTKAKAKAVAGMLDKFVSLAKRGDINSRRRVLASLDNAKDATNTLFTKIAPAFAKRNSGFTRLIMLPVRRGDMAKMVRIEWTEKIEDQSTSKSKKEIKRAKKEKVETKKTIKKES